MPDPGGGPGRDPPDDSGPSEEEVDDLTVGPGPDVNVEEYRLKIINRFKKIGAAEERLKALRAEHKAFKAKYFQAYSKHRTALRPELLELESKVKQQVLFLEKLKEKSGAFKEKFVNEQRFASQKDPSVRSVDQPSDDPAPSASAPLPPRQDWGSPAATSQGVENQHGALRFIQQMESPLRADKFAFTNDPEEIPEYSQRRYKPAKKMQVERSYYTRMAPCSVSGIPTAMDVEEEKALCKQQPEGVEACKENLQEESSEEMKEKAPANVCVADKQHEEEPVLNASETTFSVPDSAGSSSTSSSDKMAAGRMVSTSARPACNQQEIESGGGGAELSADRQNVITAAVETACSSVSGAESALSNKNSIAKVQHSAQQEKEMADEDLSFTNTAVSTDTVMKTSGTVNVTTSKTNEAMELLVGGGPEGVNGNSSTQTAGQPALLSATDCKSAGRNGSSYASVLGSVNREGGGVFSRFNSYNAGKFGGGLVPGFKRRNVVQLKWEGEGTPPVRGRVVELILDMGFVASQIFALICPVGSFEYDLSFMKPEGLDLFWERYEKCKGLSQWNGLVPKVISRQPLIKLVTILIRNESIPEADLIVWLRRYGEVITPLRKTLDEHGIWTGAWTVSLKLGVLGNVVQHLPSSAFLGRDRLTIFYQGQPKVCNRCGDKGHFASSCTLKKCSLCQGIGHLARECTQIRCNLCQQLGHPYSQCPEALHNLPDLETVLRRLDEEDKAAEAREEAGVAPPSVSVTSVVSKSVNVPPSNVVPESVSSVVTPIVKERRSSRLAEAAGGAGLADLPPRPVSPPVPPPRQRKRSQRSVKGLGEDGVDGGQGGVSISHVSPSAEGDSDDQGWERGKGKKKKKKRRMIKVAHSSSDSDIGDLSLSNRYAVLSGDEMMSDVSISLSMDEGESESRKRAVSGDEGVVEVKKRLPQSS